MTNHICYFHSRSPTEMSSDTHRRWWRRSEVWNVISALLLGQLASFILALINFTSSLSANLGANSPGLFGYVALTVVNGSILLHQRHKLIVTNLLHSKSISLCNF
ncbi:hypothetical protein Hanom_Chr13g01229081 [Helianthus anomalus]